MPKPRTKLQNKAIYVLLSKHKIDADLKAEMVSNITKGRTTHTSQMYFHEANELIVQLKGTPVNMARRTVQHHRQQAGVTVMVSADQMELIGRLAGQYFDTESGLKTWATKMIGHYPPRTSPEAIKLIEALKQMVARKGTKEAA